MKKNMKFVHLVTLLVIVVVIDMDYVQISIVDYREVILITKIKSICFMVNIEVIMINAASVKEMYSKIRYLYYVKYL